jgi:O-methyltransferase
MSFDATVQRIPHTLVGSDRLRVLWDTVQHCLPLGGDLLEVGVYKGGTAILLREAAPDRALYLYDTFAGHPYSDATRDDVNHYPGRFADTSEQAVRALFTEHPNPPIITAGVFPASAPVIPPLCFAHVDVDLYQATREACEAIWPALVLGGQLVCDDYGFGDCPGAKRAIREFAAAHADAELEELPTLQARLTKKRRA